ncbi:MAG: phytoene/squalene synthase family protein [Candidatus Woesearchaeota archaeon]
MSIRFEKIFKRASTTYYYSSIFFPKRTKIDIFALYAYVRTADDYVDSTPQDSKGFLQYKKETFDMLDGKRDSDNMIIAEFVRLSKRKGFEREWIVSFLNAMESDLTKKTYDNSKELDLYIYGSAEVIGLMICKIIGIKKEYYQGAKKMGYSMQLINFIRDIEEDNNLGRTYIPEEEYKKHGLNSLTRKEAVRNGEAFENIIREQIKKYKSIKKEAHKSLRGIPYRQRIPIKTASDLYNWTADQIDNNPMIVYSKKVKPKKSRVILYIIRNAIFPW